jgi:hypothetical protein
LLRDTYICRVDAKKFEELLRRMREQGAGSKGAGSREQGAGSGEQGRNYFLIFTLFS